jgi:hypothetical protein
MAHAQFLSVAEGGHNLHVRTRADRLSEEEESTAGALVVHKGGDHTPKGDFRSSLQLLPFPVHIKNVAGALGLATKDVDS